ncbi:MAG: penicillin-binding transpeptidase domain-containing protein [Finegoldia sp.]|nr:penicillin-binding transpeptidase domain-containing protein [Finegoldia sp.]
MNRRKKFIKKLNKIDRFDFVAICLVIFMLILVSRLFYLIVVKGSYYSEIAENNRLREIRVDAPRGNIYDRNGNILATTKNVYKSVVYKNLIKKDDAEVKNEKLLRLSRILEEDGAMSADEFPINLNAFSYENLDDYTDKNPTDKVVDIIKDKKLMDSLIKKTYSQDTNQGKYKKSVLDFVLNSLRAKGIDFKLKKDPLKFDTEDENTKELMQEYEIDENADVYSAIAKIVADDSSIIRKMCSDDVIRSIIYDGLKEKNLQDNIILIDMEFDDREKYIDKKVELMGYSDKVTFKSNAKDDFINITDENSLADILSYVPEDGENLPIQKALDILNKNGLKIDLSYELADKDDQKVISFKNAASEDPIGNLVKGLREKKLVADFLTDDEIKFVAQEVNTDKGLNLSISVNDWEYSYLKNINDLYEKFDIDRDKNVKDLYAAMLEEYKCNVYSKYDGLNLLAIYNRLENLNAKEYMPVSISYNLTEESVTSIEENFSTDSGISVETEPIRYYPNGELAAHVLGYVGKISGDDEIQKYIEEKGYANDEIIGKTGIEESSEGSLKGKDGSIRVLVDSKGNRIETISEEKAIPGNNVFLSIDKDIQKVAEKSLKQTIDCIRTGDSYKSEWGERYINKYSNAASGAAVAVDVETGEVLAMASYPSYNPNLFSTGISASDWKSLQAKDPKDPLSPRPLYNIPMQAALQPGSIFKLASSLTALEDGFDPYYEIPCGGYVNVGGSTFGCWIWNEGKGTHGSENVFRALRDSCNYYFYSLALGEDQRRGVDIGYELGIDSLLETTKKLGLNETTNLDINIPREAKGTVPDPNIKTDNQEAIFRKFLENNAGKYLKEDTNFTDEELKEKIEIIVSYMYDEESQDRKKLIENLDSLGFDAEKVLDGEKSSFADKIKFDYLDQASWNIGDMLNVVIGQGQNAYTPLEMARYMSCFVNGGYKNNLYLINEIRDKENFKLIYKNSPVREKINLKNDQNLEYVKEGLESSVSEGYEKTLFEKFPMGAGVKTGTAQVGYNPSTGQEYDNNSWMISFAPADKPKVAVVSVVIQGGDSVNNGPMTRDILAAALKLKPEDADKYDDQGDNGDNGEDNEENNTENENNE